MPFVKGFLHVVDRGAPDNELPDMPPPVDPGFGIPGLPPMGSTLPEGPPGVWPPLHWHNAVQPLPPGSNVPPGAIWPPVGGPPHPWDPIPPDASTKPPEAPPSPGAGHPDRPPGKPDGKFWVVAGIPGVGWRYVCVDINAKPPPDPAGKPPPVG